MSTRPRAQRSSRHGRRRRADLALDVPSKHDTPRQSPHHARPELKNFRRIVVKVGSSLLVDSAAGEAAQPNGLRRSPPTSPSCMRTVATSSSSRQAPSRWAAAALKLPRGPLKLEQSQAAATVGQIALARIWAEVLGQHGIGAGQILRHAQRHRGAPPLSQRPLHHRQRCWNGARCRSSTRTTRWPPPRSAMATMTAWRRASRPWSSADLPGAALRYRRALHRAARRTIPMRSSFQSSSSVTAEIEGDGGRRREPNCRAAACTPRSRPPRSRPPRGTHMIIASGKVEHPLQNDRRWRPLHLVPDPGKSRHLRANAGLRDRWSRRAR